VCRKLLIESIYCWCAIGIFINNQQVAYVQYRSYWRKFLLMCSRVFIDYTYCLCAGLLLLNFIFAYVQPCCYLTPSLLMCTYINYWTLLLFICNDHVIKPFACLCALLILLKGIIACVRYINYWNSWLLMCISFDIELYLCLCAGKELLSYLFAHV